MPAGAGRLGDDAERAQLAPRELAGADEPTDSAGSRASSANASVSRPSPERIAMPSP